MKYAVVCLSILNALCLCSQDIHWSQPAGAIIYINPAFTGSSGRFGLAAGYRDQWNAITSNYKTASLAADYRLGTTKQPLAFNAGVIFYNDVSGGGTFRTNCFGLTVSSLVRTGKNSFFGAGVAYQTLRTTAFTEKYSWGSQYNGRTYDPQLASGEQASTLMSDYRNLSAGIAFVFEEEANAGNVKPNRHFIAGYSADHINRPKFSLAGFDELMMKHTVFVNAYLPAGPDRALKPLLIAQVQGPYAYLLTGALWRHSLGQVSRLTGIRKGSGVAYGLMYRVADALIPVVEFERDNILFGLSYDINISRLTPASRLRGGFELSIRIKPVSRQVTVQTKQPTTRSMYGQ